MSDVAAREILVAGARALARPDGSRPSLQVMADSIATALGAASAAIVSVDPASGGLAIVASYGLGDADIARLADAIRDPGHPIARTIATREPAFDVVPTRPGGPALRTHAPLIVARDGSQAALGVLALAHDLPIDASLRPILLAGADLAAVAIERTAPPVA